MRQGNRREEKIRQEETRQYNQSQSDTRRNKAMQVEGRKEKPRQYQTTTDPESQSRDMNESHEPEITHKQAKRTAIPP